MSAAADFEALVTRFATAATAGDGAAFAACFAPDGVYHDYIYGPHTGRAAIANMLVNLFHRDAVEYDWQFFDLVGNERMGYGRSLSRFVSRIEQFKGREVVIDGISQFLLKDGLISEYRESVNAGVAQSQLGVAPERMAKVMARWAEGFRGRVDVEGYRAAVVARYAMVGK